MKIYIYKTLFLILALYVLFEFTIGSRLDYYQGKIDTFSNKENRDELVVKIKEEMRKAIEKEDYLTEEERYLIVNFIRKIQKELSTVKID